MRVFVCYVLPVYGGRMARGVHGQASMLGRFHSVDFIFILALAKRNFSPRRMPCFNFPQRAFSVRARTACQLWTELAVKTQ